ncbi:MAG TPA: prepilin-type N-terminal cleavage/methylation domain-containing protein [Anaerolineaceae bacterium]
MSRRRPFTNQRARAGGFTLIEVLISTVILTVGLLGVAAMIGSTIAAGGQAKGMNIANVLASEKLDDLNRWPSSADEVRPGGALGSAPCAAGDPYCDQVTVSQTSGADYETQTVGGVTTTIVHTQSGCVDTPANCGVADPVGGGGSTFIRRWLITYPNPLITAPGGAQVAATGTRRITVQVTLVNSTSHVPVTFQMSMVRP